MMFRISGTKAGLYWDIVWDNGFIVADNPPAVRAIENLLALYEELDLFEAHIPESQYQPHENRLLDPLYCYVFLMTFFFRDGDTELIDGAIPELEYEPGNVY